MKTYLFLSLACRARSVQKSAGNPCLSANPTANSNYVAHGEWFWGFESVRILPQLHFDSAKAPAFLTPPGATRGSKHHHHHQTSNPSSALFNIITMRCWGSRSHSYHLMNHGNACCTAAFLQFPGGIWCSWRLGGRECCCSKILKPFFSL